MIRDVLYVAAPLRPTEGEIASFYAHTVTSPGRPAELALRANLDRALRWLAWLRKSFPDTTFIAPWISAVSSGADDTDTAQREARIIDACAVIERCDGIVLCGGRISSGMRREMEHGRDNRPSDVEMNDWPFDIYNLTKGGDEPPSTPTPLKISLKRCAAIFTEYRGGRTIPADEWELL